MSLMSGIMPPAWEVVGAATAFNGPSSCIMEAVVGRLSAPVWGGSVAVMLPALVCSWRRSRCRCSISGSKGIGAPTASARCSLSRS
eukprot:14196006-Alexandrium_andersonii.AAC.1